MEWFQSLFLWNSPSDVLFCPEDRAHAIVSILVFVELALGPQLSRTVSPSLVVSILVFVELALGQRYDAQIKDLLHSFNPCFCGTRPRTCHIFQAYSNVLDVSILVFVELALGLRAAPLEIPSIYVSILVFVELALGQQKGLATSGTIRVSILVFVELALGHSRNRFTNSGHSQSFNPCFCGTRPRTVDAQMA